MFFLGWLPLLPEMTVCLTIIITIMFSIIKPFILWHYFTNRTGIKKKQEKLTYFDSRCYLLNIMTEVVLFSA